MVYILVLIAWNGTLATVPQTFQSLSSCQSAGEAWRVEAKGTVTDPRWACFPADLRAH
jgi:hypothetical protein